MAVIPREAIDSVFDAGADDLWCRGNAPVSRPACERCFAGPGHLPSGGNVVREMGLTDKVELRLHGE